MNPSARGWIKKLLKSLDSSDIINNVSEEQLYLKLRTCGFIYGSNMSTAEPLLADKDYTNEERCKINLFIALINTYNNSKKSLLKVLSLSIRILMHIKLQYLMNF